MRKKSLIILALTISTISTLAGCGRVTTAPLDETDNVVVENVEIEDEKIEVTDNDIDVAVDWLDWEENTYFEARIYDLTNISGMGDESHKAGLTYRYERPSYDDYEGTYEDITYWYVNKNEPEKKYNIGVSKIGEDENSGYEEFETYNNWSLKYNEAVNWYVASYNVSEIHNVRITCDAENNTVDELKLFIDKTPTPEYKTAEECFDLWKETWAVPNGWMDEDGNWLKESPL